MQAGRVPAFPGDRGAKGAQAGNKLIVVGGDESRALRDSAIFSVLLWCSAVLRRAVSRTCKSVRVSVWPDDWVRVVTKAYLTRTLNASCKALVAFFMVPRRPNIFCGWRATRCPRRLQRKGWHAESRRETGQMVPHLIQRGRGRPILTAVDPSRQICGRVPRAKG